MATKSDDIGAVIRKRIERFGTEVEHRDVGEVIEVGDGIARIYGLDDAMAGEILEFDGGARALALNLEQDTVGAVLLAEAHAVRQGDVAKRTGRILEVPTGDELLGRVVSPLGDPLDGKGPVDAKRARPLERVAPGIVERQPVRQPVQTGIKAIDAMTPIGRGQRELIIGDRQTGKTAIAIDTILNQKGQDLVCIYVAIGQKRGAVARIVDTLERGGAMDYTIIVAATASDAATWQYLAPYAGVAIGEDFMERGMDALCIYDDLSKHAWAYRQLALLLRRPPGREAYPGDVFYLHSRLLERAVKLMESYRVVDKDGKAVVDRQFDGPLGLEEAEKLVKEKGDSVSIQRMEGTGGSLTALPIIETQAGDVSAYIPTNVISITDGQIYLESDLFNQGVRPAINAGISVSRVGGNAQIPAMKKVAGMLRLDLAQYRELAAFAQFGAELDASTQRRLTRGERTVEILKQPQYRPVPVEEQIASIFAVTRGHLDEVDPGRVGEFEEGLHEFMREKHADVLESIREEKKLTPEIDEALEKAVGDFASSFSQALGGPGAKAPEAAAGDQPPAPDEGESDGSDEGEAKG
ncbi:MAG: F0F1 ATP synthase subunit alpha [Planctomycetota bacterium]|jgi:F-type H+-transporting ATPase subunit alpha